MERRSTDELIEKRNRKPSLQTRREMRPSQIKSSASPRPVQAARPCGRRRPSADRSCRARAAARGRDVLPRSWRLRLPAGECRVRIAAPDLDGRKPPV